MTPDLPTAPGAIIRAMVANERVVLVRADVDTLPWLEVPYSRDGVWRFEHELDDVEVLFPGVPS